MRFSLFCALTVLVGIGISAVSWSVWPAVVAFTLGCLETLGYFTYHRLVIGKN